MTNTLTVLRTDIVSRLTAAGLNAYGYVPAAIEAPLFLVLAGSPYVVAPTEDNTFCSGDTDALINYDILVFASAMDNETAVDELEQLVSDAIHALSGYGFVQVSKPGKMGDTPTLGCIISISHVDSL